MSVLAASVQPSGLFESPANGAHVLGSGGPPPAAVPGALFSTPRIETRPATQPGSRAPIPTSSQRPHQLSNSRICYTRQVNALQAKQGLLQDMQEGDVVFVHKEPYAMVRRGPRHAQAATLHYVNTELRKCDERGVLDLRDAKCLTRVKAVRIAHYKALEQKHALDRAALEDASTRKPYTLPASAEQRYKERIDRAERLRVEAAERLAEAEALDPESAQLPTGALANYDFECDFWAVPLLDAWRPDGLLIGMDGREEGGTSRTASLDAMGVEAELLNVAVEGPAVLRNTKSKREYKNEEKEAQRVDYNPRVQDTAILMLKHYRKPWRADDVKKQLEEEKTKQSSAEQKKRVQDLEAELQKLYDDLDNPDTPIKICFQWVLTTQRQFDVHLARAAIKDMDRPIETPTTASADEFARALGYYTIGRWMDTSRAQGFGLVHLKMEWRSVLQLLDEKQSRGGLSVAMIETIIAAKGLNVTEAIAEAGKELRQPGPTTDGTLTIVNIAEDGGVTADSDLWKSIEDLVRRAAEAATLAALKEAIAWGTQNGVPLALLQGVIEEKKDTNPKKFEPVQISPAVRVGGAVTRSKGGTMSKSEKALARLRVAAMVPDAVAHGMRKRVLRARARQAPARAAARK